LLSSAMSSGCAELGGDGRKVLAWGFGWNEWALAGGLDERAARRSPEDTRLKCRTVDGEFPKVRSTPRGCLGALLTRRAVEGAAEGLRIAVPAEDCREAWRRRSGTGESLPTPRGPALRSMRCINEAQSPASPEGIRAILRRLAVCFAGVTVIGFTVSKIQSSSSVLGERSTLNN
jgi:hypothetical protein